MFVKAELAGIGQDVLDPIAQILNDADLMIEHRDAWVRRVVIGAPKQCQNQSGIACLSGYDRNVVHLQPHQERRQHDGAQIRGLQGQGW